MADLEAGTVTTTFTADTSELSAGLKKAAKQLNTFGDQSKATGKQFEALSGTLEGSSKEFLQLGRAIGLPTGQLESVTARASAAAGAFEGLTGVTVVAGAAMAALAIGTGIAAYQLSSMTLDVAQQVEAQSRLAERTGISVRTQQQWSVAMREIGVNAGSLTTSMRTLSKHIVDSNDASSDSARIFRAMGITGTDTEQVLRELADAFASMPDGAEKSRRALELLGRGGLELLPILNKGAQAFDDSAKRAQAYGLVLTESQVKVLNDVDDAWDRVGLAMDGFKTQIAVAVAGPLKDFLNWTSESIASLTKWIKLLEHTRDLLSLMPMDVPGAVQGPPKPKLEKGMTKVLPLPSGAMQGQMQDATEPGPFANPLDLSKNFARGTESLGVFLKQMKMLQKQGIITQDDMGSAIVMHTQYYDIAAARAKEFAEMQAGAQSNQVEESARKRRNDLFALDIENGRTMLALEADQRAAIEEGNWAVAEQIQMRRDELAIITDVGKLDARKITASENGYKSLQANLIANYNTERQGIEGLRKVHDTALAHELEAARSVHAEQEAIYSTEAGMIGASDAIRQTALAKMTLEWEQAHTKMADDVRDTYGDSLYAQEEYARRSLELERQRDTGIRNIVQQYPSFFEKQMRDVVNSNTFSVSQIVTTWTGGIANSIVKGGEFAKQAWEATQVAIVQGAINTGVQLAAQWALRASVEQGIIAANTAVKLGLAQTEATAAELINAQKNAGIIAGETATATATAGIWASTSTFVIGVFGTVTSAMSAMFVGMMSVITAVGTFIMGVLTAIAEALTATVFGIPYAGAIMLGVVLIGAAIAAGVGAFAKGGIVTGPTLGLMGEAGSAEAAIPLNDRGAAFMQQTMGLSAGTGAGTEQTIIIQLDGRTISKAVANDLPSMLRLKGLPA